MWDRGGWKVSKKIISCIIIIIIYLSFCYWVVPEIVFYMIKPSLKKMIDSEFDRQVGILIEKEIMENL